MEFVGASRLDYLKCFGELERMDEGILIKKIVRIEIDGAKRMNI